MTQQLLTLKADLLRELNDSILSFWLKMEDKVNGGFLGRVDGEGVVHHNAEKGAVLNCRILWSFSAAYRITGNKAYLDAATRAKDYLLKYFVDKEYGGIFWSVTFEGKPLQTKKQIYAQGFAIYGLSEYFRATGDTTALEAAQKLYLITEKYAYDSVEEGYFEAFTREWGQIEDMRLSDKDQNQSKTMNTHLHIIEPYVNLLRVWRSPDLEQSIRRLLDVFKDHIYQPLTGHLGLFFDDDWSSHSVAISYGHDIEASWLLHEAALELGDKEYLKMYNPIVVNIAKAAAEGLLADGSMIYEYDPATKHIDRDRHWWVQAETVVGYYNIYQHFGDSDALDKALACWKFIASELVDHSIGEWYWSVRANGTKNSEDDRAGLWKCPYHNARMCLELIERIKD